MKVTDIYAKVLYNSVNRAVFSGFGQAASSKQVREFMFKGRDIASNHLETLSVMLCKENVPTPSTSESFITDSTTAPFSDKLMMLLALGLTSLILITTGIAIATSFRKDIQVNFARASAEYGKYASDGLSIMIDNGWMEQPPQLVKGEKLVQS